MQKRRSYRRGALSVLTALLLIGGTAACAAQQPLLPAEIESAREDLSNIYDSDCYASYDSPAVPECVLTNPDSDFSVYFVGDSHAAQWVPALTPIAERYGWRLVMFGKRACSFSVNEHNDNQGNAYPSCGEWNENALTRILQDRPDAVITANYARNKVMRGEEILDVAAGGPGEEALAEGMVAAWSTVLDAGIPMAVIRDTPYAGFNVPDCLLENLEDPDACSLTVQEAVTDLPHPELIAAERLPAVSVIDLTDAICGDGETCHAVQDRTVVWRDKHHLTETYAAQLEDELETALREIPALAEGMQ